MNTDFKYKTKQLDTTARAKYYIHLLGLKSDFETVMNNIKEYGLPTTRDFILTHAQPVELRKYFNKQLQDELQEYGGELADDTDRQRLIEKWKNLFSTTEGYVIKAAEILNKGLLPTVDNEDGTPTVDTARLETLADELATFTIDSKALTEYHSMIVDFYERRKALKEYEDTHHLQGFSQGKPITYADLTGVTLVPVSTDIDNYFKETDTAERWLKVFGKQFTTSAQPTDDKLQMLM